MTTSAERRREKRLVHRRLVLRWALVAPVTPVVFALCAGAFVTATASMHEIVRVDETEIGIPEAAAFGAVLGVFASIGYIASLYRYPVWPAARLFALVYTGATTVGWLISMLGLRWEDADSGALRTLGQVAFVVGAVGLPFVGYVLGIGLAGGHLKPTWSPFPRYRCKSCGYDRRGLGEWASCPECNATWEGRGGTRCPSTVGARPGPTGRPERPPE